MEKKYYNSPELEIELFEDEIVTNGSPLSPGDYDEEEETEG